VVWGEKLREIMDLTFWVIVIYLNSGWLPNGGGVTWISYFFVRFNMLGRCLPYRLG
jgi:hypothetical protein